MRSRIKKILAGAFLGFAVFTLSACSSHKVSYQVPAGMGEKTVQIKASSFGFEPNEITAQAGDRLLFQVLNTAGITHNLTLVDPQGNPLFSLDLAGNQSQTKALVVSQTGEYTFHCDKPLHSTMGMTGRILVSPGS